MAPRIPSRPHNPAASFTKVTLSTAGPQVFFVLVSYKEDKLQPGGHNYSSQDAGKKNQPNTKPTWTDEVWLVVYETRVLGGSAGTAHSKAIL